MLGQVTQLTLNASFLALNYEQMAWPQTEERFRELRQEVIRLLQTIDINDVDIPDTQEAYLGQRPAINGSILKRLADDRSKILGDTVALPVEACPRQCAAESHKVHHKM